MRPNLLAGPQTDEAKACSYDEARERFLGGEGELGCSARAGKSNMVWNCGAKSALMPAIFSSAWLTRKRGMPDGSPRAKKDQTSATVQRTTPLGAAQETSAGFVIFHGAIPGFWPVLFVDNFSLTRLLSNNFPLPS